MHGEQKEMISVIIPVYRVEQFLDKCINSVICQTYDNLEIILVDDGSPDQSGVICDEWAKKESRIKVIHKENGGLSDARNAGVKIAIGEYIAFVDGDDWIAPDMFEILKAQLQGNACCDIAVCGVKKVYTEDEVTEAEDEKKVTLLSGQVALEQLINGQISQVVWNKLYRKSIIENIYFEVGKYHEDEFWSYQVIGKARKVSLTEHIGYYYRQRQGSIMDEAYSVRRLDVIEAKCRRQVYLEKNYPKLISCGKMNLLFACLYHGQLALCSMSRSERISIHKYLQKTMRKNHLSKSEKREIPLKYKTWLVSANYTFTFVCWIRNLLRIGL